MIMGRTSQAREKLMKAVLELIWTGSYGSTTIDLICERAGVRKGSFYHFFASKAALATEAIETDWQEYRPRLNDIFSPSLAPLERIRRYCAMEYEDQVALKALHGRALGCPLCTLGTEICGLEDGLRRKVNEVMDQYRRYFETTIRDAQAEGCLPAADAGAKARAVFAYIEGLLSQARIRNDVGVLREMERGILDLLGARSEPAHPA